MLTTKKIIMGLFASLDKIYNNNNLKNDFMPIDLKSIEICNSYEWRFDG